MDHLPLSDIPMLVSTINFLLRDGIFENLDQICYCFNVEREEMGHIEDCIANYANSMSKELFAVLSNGNEAFLHEHTTFQDDQKKAVCVMEEWLEFKTS